MMAHVPKNSIPLSGFRKLPSYLVVCVGVCLFWGSIFADEKITASFELILDETGPRGAPEELYQAMEIFPPASVELEDGVLKFRGIEGNQLLFKGVESLFPEGASWTLLIRGKANLVDRVMVPLSLANSNDDDDRIVEVQIRPNCENMFVAAGGSIEPGRLQGLTVDMKGSGEFVAALSYNAGEKSMIIRANDSIKKVEAPRLQTPAPDEALMLGAFRSGFGAFDGEISTLRIFDRALTEDELLLVSDDGGDR